MLLVAGFYTGDVIFQVIAFLLLVAIPVGIEAKIDRLLEQKSD